MIEQSASISALIGPTITDFAADVGCGYKAARQMRRRNAPQHWAHVVTASHRRGIAGVSYELLARHRSAGAPQGQPA
jgi:hypothetical protein